MFVVCQCGAAVGCWCSGEWLLAASMVCDCSLCVCQAEIEQTVEEAVLLEKPGEPADGDQQGGHTTPETDSAAALRTQLAAAHRQLDTVKSKLLYSHTGAIFDRIIAVKNVRACAKAHCQS